MADDAAIHLPKELSAALAAEAARAGVSIEALAEEAIARHLEGLKTLEHFAQLKASADWDLLNRVLSRASGEAPVSGFGDSCNNPHTPSSTHPHRGYAPP